MADGSVIFDTKLDTSGVVSGLSSLASGALKTATAGLAALGTYAISVGSDFESAISNVAATMGTTSDQIAAITDKAKELGATTAFSATEAAEGFNILAQSGLSADQQLSTITPTLSLAAAGEMEMAEAAGYITTTMKAMGIEMDEAGTNATRVADLYAKGATLANTSTAEFGDAVSSAASIAGAYNQSLDTTGTALLALAEKGYTGSAAGTYLGRAMSDLYAPTSNAAEALEKLGVKAYDSAGNQRDFIDVIDDLNAAFADMTEEEKAAYTGTIFTTAGLKAFNSIAGNSSEELAKLKADLNDCTGAAEQMANTKLDNLTGDITILKSTAEGFGISIYENMQEPLRAFAQEGISIMSDLKSAVDEGGLSGLAGAVGDALSRAITMISGYAPRLATAAVDLVHSFISSISEAAPTLATVAVEIGTTLLSGFLTIIADMISLGGDLVAALCDGLAAGVPLLLNAVASGIEEILSAIVEHLPQVIESLTGLLTSLAQSMVDSAGLFVDAAVNIINALVSALPEIITAIIDMLPQLVQSIADGIVALASDIAQAGVELLTSLVSSLPEIIQQICLRLPEIISGIVGALLGMIPQLVDCGVQLLVSLVQALPEIIYSIVACMPVIIASVVSALIACIPQIIECGIQLLTSLVSALPQIILAIVAVLPSIVMSIISALIDNIPLIIQCGIDLLTSLISALPEIITAIIAAAPTIIASIIQALVSNIGLIVQCGIQLFTSLITAIPQIISTIVAAIPQIVSSIVQAFSNLRGQLVSAGSNLLLGLAEGIGNAIGGVVSKAISAAQRIVSAVKSAFGIASPSKVFRDVIGKNLMLGLAGGIDNNAAEAVEAAQEVADQIRDVDYTPDPDDIDFTPPSPSQPDYDALLGTARATTYAVTSTTARAVSSGGVATTSAATSVNSNTDDSGSGKPTCVAATFVIDGKTFARATTPYIEKELDWRDK